MAGGFIIFALALIAIGYLAAPCILRQPGDDLCHTFADTDERLATIINGRN